MDPMNSLCRSNAYVSAGGDRRRREKDFAKFVKSQDKEMKEFVSKRDKLVKTYEDKKEDGFEKIQQEEREKVLGREPLRSEVVEKKQDTANQVWGSKPGGQVMDNIRVYLMTQILTIKNKEYNRITSAHQYGGQDVYSHPQNTQVSGYLTAQVSGYSTFNKEGKGEKMIQAVLQEEIGGKGVCITNSQPAMACESPLYSTNFVVSRTDVAAWKYDT